MTGDVPGSGGRLDIVAVAAAALAEVAAGADALNALDGIAGDGDLGLTVRSAAEAIGRLASAPAPAPTSGPAPAATTADAIRSIGAELARAAASTAGTLLAFGCLAAAAADVEPGATAATELAVRLEAATASIARRGRAEPGEKTMLDALEPAARAVRAAADTGASGADALEAGARAAADGAAATAAMTAVHGRAGWLADRSQGHEDAGARLVALLMTAAVRHIPA